MGTTTAPNAYQFQVRGCNGPSCSAWVVGPKFSTMAIDESNSSFVSFNGTWTTQNITGAYNGAVRFASTSKDKAQLPNKVTFTTTGSMAWITMMGPDRGQAVVHVDGNPAVNVDLYSPTVKVAVIGYTANRLAGGQRHNMTINVVGAKNALSTGNRVDVDGFVLLE